jgi:hypothetical protein
MSASIVVLPSRPRYTARGICPHFNFELGEIYVWYGSACPRKGRLRSSYYQEGPRSGYIHIGIPYRPRSGYTR